MDGYNSLKQNQGYSNEGKLPSGSNNASFTVLDADSDGVGDYHFNHYIAFFKRPLTPFFSSSELKEEKDFSSIKTSKYLEYYEPKKLTKILFKKFDLIFSPNEAAEAEFYKKNDKQIYHGKEPVIKFTGKIDWRPDLHDDYVSLSFISDNSNSRFYGKTLQNNDISLTDGAMLYSKVFPHPLVPDAPMFNNRHFLAGRRSWKIGFNEKNNLFYIETAGFERYSEQFYVDNEEKENIREMITTTWVTLLKNYVSYIGSTTQNSLIFGHKYSDDWIQYRAEASSSGNSLKNTEWIKHILKRHPELIA